MLRNLLLAGVVIAASAAAAGAHAELIGNEHITRVRVTFKAEELAPARAETAYARLYKAAQVACGTEGAGPAYRAADEKACEGEAMNEAIADLHQPAMTQLHQSLQPAPQVASVDRKPH